MSEAPNHPSSPNQITHWFDRSKPFYPLVMAYVINLHGIKEVMVQGVRSVQKSWSLINTEKVAAVDIEQIKSDLEKLLGPLQLEISGEQDRLEISVEEIATEFVKEHQYLLSFQIQSATNCLVMAHEVTKGKPYRDYSPIWEFLRHCRNAIAHNGKFHFEGSEPKRPAKWRNLEITASMQGQPLFPTVDGKAGFLKLGDPIALLADIEREFPSIAL